MPWSCFLNSQYIEVHNVCADEINPWQIVGDLIRVLCENVGDVFISSVKYVI